MISKKLFIFAACIILLCFCLVSCGGIEIPDIANVDEMSAKNLLSSNGLIPVIAYEYDDYIAEGCVIYTEPSIGSSVEKNSKVTLYVSKGPAYIEARDAQLTWQPVGDDCWEFYSPYILEDTLYIECHNVVLDAEIVWLDNYNQGRIIGTASINDTYDKTIPVSAEYTKQKWNPKEPQSFTLEIPLGDLNVDKPTSLYVNLYADVDGVSLDIQISFTISW